MPITPFSIWASIAPAIIASWFSHYWHRSELKGKPSAHLSYHEGIVLIREFIRYASHRTVEELQEFTAQSVPRPPWIWDEAFMVSQECIDRAASALIDQLGAEGLIKIGGQRWWQWRQDKLVAEWIETKKVHDMHSKHKQRNRRVLMFVHGGAYYFGSVNTHKYQLHRHARQLRAKILAPNYRLAPQFPFPCALQDCLATYLHLLSIHPPEEVILAGDSAGGGMVLSLLCILRDQGLPLPAGSILVSPWVDLTHSFPSIRGDASDDYIPATGFHHRPSAAWPPLNLAELQQLSREALFRSSTACGPAGGQLSDDPQIASQQAMSANGGASQEAFVVGPVIRASNHGQTVEIHDQVQLYASNSLLHHDLVSPVLQATLGGLPPLLVLTGGGEVLRDEQIYIAHKAADPSAYPSPMNRDRSLLAKYPPTDVQLQVWDDACHVALTLSWTEPAKLMYRSFAQFGAWALARAQKRAVDITEDDWISDSSDSDSSTTLRRARNKQRGELKRASQHSMSESEDSPSSTVVGRAGDALPPFVAHMIRQRVDRHGNISQLESAEALTALAVPLNEIGRVNGEIAQRWRNERVQWDRKYKKDRIAVHKRRAEEIAEGYSGFDPDEKPPAAALASRTRGGELRRPPPKKRSLGFSMWSGWGQKFDEKMVKRESEQDRYDTNEEKTVRETQPDEDGVDGESRQVHAPPGYELSAVNPSRIRSRPVVDEGQSTPESHEEKAGLIMSI